MEGRLSELAAVLSARLQGDDAPFAGASIDARSIQPGALFFALAGERVDGHAFVDQARQAGAAAAVVSQPVATDLPLLRVDDVQQALQQAAGRARQLFVGPVVGVTGSNGKTTVKQMLQSILTLAGPALATAGNLNNHLGVPLTLMRLDNSVDRAVIEMGANHPGEIDQLAALARPDIGLITNAGWAHLEGFGSRTGIARGKGELFTQLSDNGTAIINADDDHAGLWHELAAPRCVLTFSIQEYSEAAVKAADIDLAPDGSTFTLRMPDGSQARLHLHLAGRHNIANAAAAAAAAWAADIALASIVAGLENMAAVTGRLAITPLAGGHQLVDDSYNANPASLAAALAWLGQQAGERWAVLGDMGELGEYARQAHWDAGLAARQAGIRKLWATGPYSRLASQAFGDGGFWFPDRDSLVAALAQQLGAGHRQVSILVKGSRSAGMEYVAQALRQNNNAEVGTPC